MPEVNIPAQETGPNAPEVAPAATDAKPTWLGDFADGEALRKSYDELRAKMSREGAKEGAAEAEAAKATEAEGEAAKATEAEATKAAEAAGLDMSTIEAEFLENGSLSDATYDALAKAGFDRARVDSYIAGQVALNEQMQSRIEQHVGGAEKLTAALEWAATGLTEAEINAFNKTIEGSDEAGIKLAMDGLMAKYTKTNGSEPNLLDGGVTGPSGSVFRSTAELTAAMRDPRYAKDPAYREEVTQKLNRSTIF
jgi:hypothetical protein